MTDYQNKKKKVITQLSREEMNQGWVNFWACNPL